MLEGKENRALDIVFPFVLAYVDTWTGFQDDAPLTKLHVQYTELTNRLMTDNFHNGWSSSDLDNIRVSISTFKHAFWTLFGPHCSHGLNTLKFHLLDHLVDDLERFGSIHVLSESLYEHFNYIVKQAYNSTSKRLKTRTADTVSNLDLTLTRQRSDHVSISSCPSSTRPRKLGLVGFGEKIHGHTLFSVQHNLEALDHPSNHFLSNLYKSFHSDAFPQFLRLLK